MCDGSTWQWSGQWKGMWSVIEVQQVCAGGNYRKLNCSVLDHEDIGYDYKETIKNAKILMQLEYIKISAFFTLLFLALLKKK